MTTSFNKDILAKAVHDAAERAAMVLAISQARGALLRLCMVRAVSLERQMWHLVDTGERAKRLADIGQIELNSEPSECYLECIRSMDIQSILLEVIEAKHRESMNAKDAAFESVGALMAEIEAIAKDAPSSLEEVTYPDVSEKSLSQLVEMSVLTGEAARRRRAERARARGQQSSSRS